MSVIHLGDRLKIVRDKQAINEDREQRLELRRKVARKERKALQRADFLKRNVPWANRDAIELFYAEAERLTRKTGIQHEVDHIVPLKGKRVSGLHVHNNLRVVTKAVNRAKSNRFDDDLVGGAGIEPATSTV